MKNKALFLFLLVPFLFSCESESYLPNDILDGYWVSVQPAKSSSLILHFDDGSLSVKNGSWNYRPFTDNASWSYQITTDSVLIISQGYFDGDDYENHNYSLSLSLSSSGKKLTLCYDPPFSSVRQYSFVRR